MPRITASSKGATGESPLTAPSIPVNLPTLELIGVAEHDPALVPSHAVKPSKFSMTVCVFELPDKNALRSASPCATLTSASMLIVTASAGRVDANAATAAPNKVDLIPILIPPSKVNTNKNKFHTQGYTQNCLIQRRIGPFWRGKALITPFFTKIGLSACPWAPQAAWDKTSYRIKYGPNRLIVSNLWI